MICFYTEFDYSIGQISIIFSLKYGTVKHWLSIFIAEHIGYESSMKTKSFTPQNHIDANEEIKALKPRIYCLGKVIDNARIKAELYNEMINVAERQLNICVQEKSSAK